MTLVRQRPALAAEMGAVKAINAAYLALRQTGIDMQSRYKETSQGGLAVNVVEC